jgi:hypothetical protein
MTYAVGFVHRRDVGEDNPLGFEMRDNVGNVLGIGVDLTVDDLAPTAIVVTGEGWWCGVDEGCENRNAV